MKIEVLYIRECPNHGPVVETIRRVLREQQQSLQEFAEVEVRDTAQAVALSFPGSPTVRVNGVDIEWDLPKLNAFGLSCRTYVRDGKRQGVPPTDLIVAAIIDALRQSFG